MKKIILIGAGLIGQERLKAAKKLQERGWETTVAVAFDPYQPKLAELATSYGFSVPASLTETLDRESTLVVVACPHDTAVPVTIQALQRGHRVLLEKPAGRNAQEADAIAAAAQADDQLVLGLNYRFMPGVVALAGDVRAGQFGDIISLSVKLGHGGRQGDERTWKLDPVRCGGGALLDPGIHVLDLVRYLLGRELAIHAVGGWSGFWRTGIEEHVTVAGSHGKTLISLDISVVRWRSEFEVFVLGTKGYGIVSGRGRSYGRQTYRRGARWGWMHAPSQSASEEVLVDDPCEDSFADELEAVLALGPPSPKAALVRRDEARDLMGFYESVKKLMRT